MTKISLERAVFMDRDGTIIHEVSYLRRIEDLKLLPGAASAISALNAADFRVIVVTNQSGIARGLFDIPFIEMVHAEINRRLLETGAKIDAWYYCPHHPDEGRPPYRRKCSCRKPGTGLIEKACHDMRIDLSRSFMVGDSLRDIETGWRASMPSVLVLTGYGKRTLAAINSRDKKRLSYVAKDILDASRWILKKCHVSLPRS